MSEKKFRPSKGEPLVDMTIGEAIDELIANCFYVSALPGYAEEDRKKWAQQVFFFCQQEITELLRHQVYAMGSLEGLEAVDRNQLAALITKKMPEIAYQETAFARGLLVIADKFNENISDGRSHWLKRITQELDDLIPILGLVGDLNLEELIEISASIASNKEGDFKKLEAAIDRLTRTIEERCENEDGPNTLFLKKVGVRLMMAKRTIELLFVGLKKESEAERVTDEKFIDYVRSSTDKIVKNIVDVGCPTDQINGVIQSYLSEWYRWFLSIVQQLYVIAAMDPEREIFQPFPTLRRDRKRTTKISQTVLDNMEERLTEMAEICSKIGQEYGIDFDFSSLNTIIAPTGRIELLH